MIAYIYSVIFKKVIVIIIWRMDMTKNCRNNCLILSSLLYRKLFFKRLTFANCIAVGQLTRDNGRMARDMGWVWKPVVVGSIEENGLRDSRVATEFDNLPHPRRDTKARGPAVYKTVTAPRPTPTAVSTKIPLLRLNIPLYLKMFRSKAQYMKFF